MVLIYFSNRSFFSGFGKVRQRSINLSSVSTASWRVEAKAASWPRDDEEDEEDEEDDLVVLAPRCYWPAQAVKSGTPQP